MSPSCFNFRLWHHQKLPITYYEASDENCIKITIFPLQCTHTIHMMTYMYMFRHIFVYILYTCNILPTYLWNAVLLHWNILLSGILLPQVIKNNNLALMSNWCQPMYGRSLPWMHDTQEVVELTLSNYYFRGSDIWVTSRLMVWSW